MRAMVRLITNAVPFFTLQTERPMKIEIVFDPAKQPLASRVAPSKVAARTGPAASTVAAAGGGGGAR
jgi:hypothetical protein